MALVNLNLGLSTLLLWSIKESTHSLILAQSIF